MCSQCFLPEGLMPCPSKCGSPGPEPALTGTGYTSRPRPAGLRGAATEPLPRQGSTFLHDLSRCRAAASCHPAWHFRPLRGLECFPRHAAGVLQSPRLSRGAWLLLSLPAMARFLTTQPRVLQADADLGSHLFLDALPGLLPQEAHRPLGRPGKGES